MKLIRPLILFILGLVAIVIVTIGIYLLIGGIQYLIFVPKDSLLWVFKSPLSQLILLFEIYLIIIFFFIFFKGYKSKSSSIKKFFKNKRVTFPIFVIGNLILIYTIIFNVTVIEKDRLVDYSFLSPQGKEYSYQDIIGIDTGVHGKRAPFLHSKGDFYYIIELSDGKKIDLTDVGGVSNQDVHEYFVINELDKQFMQLGISKVASMKYFDLATEHLDKMYTDQFKDILENTN